MHYSRTLEDWLALHDAARGTIMPLFEQTYGKEQASGAGSHWRPALASAMQGKARWARAEACRTQGRAICTTGGGDRQCLRQTPPCIWCLVQALCWFVRWRLFYLACSELFAYDGGNEWGVLHMLLKKR